MSDSLQSCSATASENAVAEDMTLLLISRQLSVQFMVHHTLP